MKKRPITIYEREAIIIFCDLVDMVQQQNCSFEIKRGQEVVAKIVPNNKS